MKRAIDSIMTSLRLRYYFRKGQLTVRQRKNSISYVMK